MKTKQPELNKITALYERLSCDDEQSDGSNEFAPFLNTMNEWYVRDTSRKIKSVLHNKGMDEKYLTSIYHAYHGRKSTDAGIKDTER